MYKLVYIVHTGVLDRYYTVHTYNPQAHLDKLDTKGICITEVRRVRL